MSPLSHPSCFRVQNGDPCQVVVDKVNVDNTLIGRYQATPLYEMRGVMGNEQLPECALLQLVMQAGRTSALTSYPQGPSLRPWELDECSAGDPKEPDKLSGVVRRIVCSSAR